MIHKKLILLAFPLALTAMDSLQIDQSDDAKEIPSLRSITFNKIIANINSKKFLDNFASNTACIPALPIEAERELASRLKSDEQGIIAKRLYILSHKVMKEHVPCFVPQISWSPDGTKIASGSWDHTMIIWDSASGKSLSKKEDSSRIHSLDWSPDGSTIACGKEYGGISLWNVSTDGDQLIKTITSYPDIYSINWRPDGSTIAFTSYSKIAMLDIRLNRLDIFAENPTWLRSATWSPDGSRIASSSQDKTVRIWDVASGESRSFQGHTEEVNSITWSPDGSTIASASYDKTVRIWDVASGESKILTDHASHIKSVAWSPDGAAIASSSNDTIKIYNTASRKSIALAGPKGCFSKIAWSPDGTKIASGSWSDGGVRILDWKKIEELDQAELSKLLQECSNMNEIKFYDHLHYLL